MTRPSAEMLERFGLLLVEGFFDEETCRRLVAEVRSAWGGPATIYTEGSSNPVNERLRKTTRFMLSEETTESVRQSLLAQKQRVERHFDISLSDCEPPQFLFYKEGDFFVPHQDGNTEQLQYDHLRVRRISAVVFLSRQSDEPAEGSYCGGSLAFYESDADTRSTEPSLHLAGEPGLLVAFRAETTHEVTPVTHGERYSIVCWYR